MVVIGGGVIGASCAYQLSKKGRSVTLVEKRFFGAGASGCSAAMLECQTHAHRGEPFLSLARKSLEMFPALAQELKDLTGLSFDYERRGILNLAMNEDEARFFKSCVEAQTKMGFQAEWLEAESVEKNYPQINPDYVGAALYSDDGQVNGELLLDVLLEAARRSGARLIDNVGEIRLEETAEGIKAVSPKAVYEAGKYVVAAGAWSNQVLGTLFSLPLTPVRGQLIFYTTPPHFLTCPVFTRASGYVVSKQRGYTLVGTTVEEVGFDDSITEEAKEELIRKGRALVPGLGRYSMRGASSGLRPKSADELPFIGPLSERKNVFVATGHFRNGMLLAPITGKIIADLVCGEDPGMDLTPFLPSRNR